MYTPRNEARTREKYMISRFIALFTGTYLRSIYRGLYNAERVEGGLVVHAEDKGWKQSNKGYYRF